MLLTLNDLLDGSRGNVIAHGGSRVDTNNDTAIELEGQSSGTLGKLDLLVGIRVSTGRGKVVATIQSGL